MYNTQPDGVKRSLHQHEHEKWNSYNYPGTRQMCVTCSDPTDRCEEDSIYCEDNSGPYCEKCYKDVRQ